MSDLSLIGFGPFWLRQMGSIDPAGGCVARRIANANPFAPIPITAFSDSSAPPCAARLGRKGMAVPVEVANSGALARAVNPGPVARHRSGAAQDRGGNPERTRACAHTDLSVGTAAVAKDAPVSAAAVFSTEILKAERLVLLMDAHRARKRHASVKGIMRRLRDVTARLAEMEA